jgi:hypothetical protein
VLECRPTQRGVRLSPIRLPRKARCRCWAALW